MESAFDDNLVLLTMDLRLYCANYKPELSVARYHKRQLCNRADTGFIEQKPGTPGVHAQLPIDVVIPVATEYCLNFRNRCLRPCRGSNQTNILGLLL